MRTIKFRAWVKFESGNFGMLDSECLKDWTIQDLLYEVEDNDTVMQWTGLKDKNGVEIYEGDIVKFRVTKLASEQQFEFKKFQGNVAESIANPAETWFCRIWNPSDMHKPERYITDSEGVDEVVFVDAEFQLKEYWYSLSLLNTIEVIGNIYENPDLIKEIEYGQIS